MLNRPSACPSCGSTDIRVLEKRQEFICEDCLHRWSAATPDKNCGWPPGLEPERLPTYLAAPLASLLAEPHPRVRLHWLVDCAELAVRWSVAIALAEVLHAGRGMLPETLLTRIRDQIERPTLGRWLDMLAILSAEAPKKPLLAGLVFKLYEDTFAAAFRTENSGGTPENSLLELRNQLAHGGGLRTAVAQALLDRHERAVMELLRTVADSTEGAEIVAIRDGSARRVAGLEPAPIPYPSILEDVTDGAYLVGRESALPLLPLARFAPVHDVTPSGALEEHPGGPAAQLYLRSDRHRLAYVPVSGSGSVAYVIDVKGFRELFGLDVDARPSRASGDAFHWQDFLREARMLREDLVGRTEETRAVKEWLKDRDTRMPGVARLGWIFGGPGLGKSMIMAKVAADLGNSKPGQQGVYYHRFRAGDARNSLRAFLQGLIAALDDWSPKLAQQHADEDREDTDQTLIETAIEKLNAALGCETSNNLPPRFLILADGLDELFSREPSLPARLRELAQPGTVLLVASRPEPGLKKAFSTQSCEAVFSNGLPSMSANDIRAMLLEGLGSARHALVARDEDVAEGVRNPFIERVVNCADGLPLYVHLLLEDLREARLSVHDERQLPQGLVAYYDYLMEQVGLSDLKRDLPLVVSALALVEEPLDIDALTLLLADTLEDVPRFRVRVENAVRGGQVMLRSEQTADGTDGLTLYHQSFREYIAGQSLDEHVTSVAAVPSMVGTVQDAEAKLCRLADIWNKLPEGNLRTHLFRWGVRYALRWQGTAGVNAAKNRLTNFAFLQAFTKALPRNAIRGLVADYEALLAQLPNGRERDGFGLWEAFFREREHLLRRGGEGWPPYKILLQLAAEHADDSPVTKAAESWLENGHCDWEWLRNPRRIARARPDACLRVLEGHTAQVNGVLALPDARLLSWSDDGTLQLWDARSGEQLGTLTGHTDWVIGAMTLPDGRLVSWSGDATFRLWNEQSGEPLATLSGHRVKRSSYSGRYLDFSVGALVLRGERLLTWSSDDKTLRLWCSRSGNLLATLDGHSEGVFGALALPNERILSWSRDHTLRLWHSVSGETIATLTGHTAWVRGAKVLSDGRLLSWSDDCTHRLWNGETGEPVAKFGKRFSKSAVPVGRAGALVLSGDRLLSWFPGHKARLWSIESGELLATLSAYGWWTAGALALDTGRSRERIISWSTSVYETSFPLWGDSFGQPLNTLKGHTGRVNGALALADRRFLTWSNDSTLRIWDSETGEPLSTLTGHTDEVNGALVLSDGQLVSWSKDGSLRLWDSRPIKHSSAPIGHSCPVKGASVLSDCRILSWSDHSIRLWDGNSGEPLVTFSGHDAIINGTLPLSDEKFLSWSVDGTLRLWDYKVGESLATLTGHTDYVKGAIALSDGRLLSWSKDGTLRLWDSETGEPLANLVGHSGLVHWGRELPNGRLLSAAADGTFRLWDSESCEPVATLSEHLERVIDYSPPRTEIGALIVPGGRLITWSSKEYYVRIWDAKSGELLATLDGPKAKTNGVVALPDGRILSWTYKGVICLWDGESGEPLGKISGLAKYVYSEREAKALDRVIAFPDGRLLFSAATFTTLSYFDGRQLSSGATVVLCKTQSDKFRLLQPKVLNAYQLSYLEPSLFNVLATLDRPTCVSGNSVGWEFTNDSVCIARPNPSALTVVWVSEGSAKVHALTPDGMLVATVREKIFPLQLFKGNRRISIAEYESDSGGKAFPLYLSEHKHSDDSASSS